LVASGVALAVGIGSAGAQSSVVGPGESIQKAVNAADPGDTIIVRGVHREDVVIRKNGIKLRGFGNAVIEVPARAKADAPCSKAFGPVAICVLGDVNKTGKLTGQRVSDVSVSGFTFRGFTDAFMIGGSFARNATVVGNRITGNVATGITFDKSVNTTIAKNHVIGNPETAESFGILVGSSSRTKIVNNVFRSYDYGVDFDESTNTTIAGNDFIGNSVTGISVFDSPGTKILSNDMIRSGIVGTFMFGPKLANAKVVGNNISGAAFGMYVTDTKGGGSFAGNTIRNNCAGMVFEANPSEPVGGFEVKGNTVENNTRSCRAAQFDSNFSGIGIALLGTTDMEVTGNQISGNIPSGPTPVSGGVVVSTDPFFGGSAKPRNNSVTGNHFGRNKPDIFWDKSGSGNRFVGNLCDTSVPSSLCN
jgi:parallel beta-helix repeat protein